MVQRMDKLKDYSKITKKLLEMHVWHVWQARSKQKWSGLA